MIAVGRLPERRENKKLLLRDPLARLNRRKQDRELFPISLSGELSPFHKQDCVYARRRGCAIRTACGIIARNRKSGTRIY
jgi:hypothetical protein